MKEAPNLNTCTAKEWADWYIAEVKQTGSVLIFPNGIFNYNAIHTLTEAFRIIGQREGYKRGKRDGSYAGYRKGVEDGISQAYGDALQDWLDENGYE